MDSNDAPLSDSKDNKTRFFIRDVVFGANDGIITTFAVVAGVAGANLQSKIVLIMGFANLLADGVSMATSNFLSLRSERAVVEPSDRYPAWLHGLATLVAFVTAGAVPLLAYLVPGLAVGRFPVAIFLTATALFSAGALRTLAIKTGWFKAGAEMLLVGTLAASIAYGVGALLATMVINTMV